MAAGLATAIGFVPSVHLALGLWLLTDLTRGKNEAPAAFFGGLFVLVAATWMLTAWSMAAGLFVAGRSLALRERRTFCLVMAGLVAVMCLPFGTILGTFTIIVLSRPAVREAFEGT